jgi:phage terminase large subunit-like protein
VLEFPPIPADPFSYILPYFFCPEDSILKRSKNDRVPYDLWADQGWLIPTPGGVINEDFILTYVGRALKNFNLKRLYFDAWGSKGVIRKLQDDYGFTVSQTEHEQRRQPLLVEFRQGDVSMSAPMKDMMIMVMDQKYAHGDNPILTWNMDNLIAITGATGLIKPDKAKSREKIDGAVALIMAHAGAMIHNPAGDKSVYAERGIITI